MLNVGLESSALPTSTITVQKDPGATWLNATLNQTTTPATHALEREPGFGGKLYDHIAIVLAASRGQQHTPAGDLQRGRRTVVYALRFHECGQLCKRRGRAWRTVCDIRR